jgi:hypothetical protein
MAPVEAGRVPPLPRLGRWLVAVRRERPVLAVAATVTLLTLLVHPLVDVWLRSRGIAPGFQFWDYGAYAGAIDRWQAGAAIYERNAEGGFHGTYLYPPVSVLLFVPLTALERGLQPMVWGAVGIGTLWLGLNALVGSLGHRPTPLERVGLLGVAAGFQPVLMAVKFGQTSAFTAGLLALGGAALCRGRDADAPDLAADGGAPSRRGTAWALISGAATACVGVLKPAYGPVGAHLLADRRRFAGAVLTGLLAVAGSLAVFGVDTHRLYLDVLAWGVERGGSARSPMLWLAPYYRPLAWLPASTVFQVGGSLLVAAAALLAVDADREVFALGLAAFPLLVPLTYTYYLAVLLPAVVVLLSGELRRAGLVGGDDPRPGGPGGTGRPLLVLAGLWLAHWHSYGLWTMTKVVPTLPDAWLPLPQPVLFCLQPGLWGNLLLVGVAGWRVAERVGAPAWLGRLLPDGTTRES